MWHLVKSSWQIVIKNVAVIGVVWGINVALGLLAFPFMTEISQATRTGQTVAVVMAAIQFLLIPFIQGGCLGFIQSRVAGGSAPAPVASFLDGGKRLYVRLLAFEALTVASVILLVLASVLLFTLSMLPAATAPALSVVLALLSAVPLAVTLYLFLVILSFTPISLAVEGSSVFGAIKRALAVGRSAIVQLFVLSLLLVVTLLPVFLIAGLPDLLARGGTDLGTAGLLIGLVLQSAAGAISMVLFLAGYVQLFRQRAGLATGGPT